MDAITYKAKAVKGKLEIPQRQALKQMLESLDGIDLTITLKRLDNDRSNPQNAYYWGILIPRVIVGLHGVGYELHELESKIVHKFLKKNFCPTIEVFNEKTNELETVKSTTALSTKQIKEYFLYIQIWATTYLGIYIPDPNETL